MYPWYTWLRCARFMAGWDSCSVVEYSALHYPSTGGNLEHALIWYISNAGNPIVARETTATMSRVICQDL